MKGKQTLDDVLASIDQTDEEACWPWPGAIHKGRAIFGRLSAAKAVWEAKVGALGTGQIVRNKCGNLVCVNYRRHLVAGTQRENMLELVAAGKHGARRLIRGEDHPVAKLTAEDVRQMRAEREPGPNRKTLTAIARERGISVSQASRVCREDAGRRGWKHLK